MIIKSMSRKAPTFGQLIAYIGRNGGNGPTFTHNLHHSGENKRLVEQQFHENYKKLPYRKNGNALFHEIIAIKPQPHLSQRELDLRLHWIAMLYMERRAPNQLAWGKVHHDTNFPHVHLMISANSVLTPKRLRLSRKDYAESQRKTEEAVRQFFPDMIMPPVHTQSHKEPGPKITRSEGSLIHRTGKPSRKQDVAHRIKDLMGGCTSIHQLETELGRAGFSLQARGSNHVLVDKNNGRRYRLKTLGLGEEMGRITKGLPADERSESEVASIQKVQAEKLVPVTSPDPKDPRIAELEALAQQRLETFEHEQEDEDRDR